MATHTNMGGDTGRKFAISRENGQVNKDGRPYFFEWIPSVPPNAGKRKFETRTGKDGKVSNYELFAALDGYLIGIDRETKMFNGNNPEAWLVLRFIDVNYPGIDEEYRVEIGRIDSRWSTDFMKRILDNNFDPRQKLRIAPISSEGKLFVSAYSGANKLESRREAAHLSGMPQPETREWKGKVEYDFTAVSEWLYERVKVDVCPRLVKDPISAPERVPIPAPPQSFPTTAATPPKAHANDPFPDMEPAGVDDDLPF